MERREVQLAPEPPALAADLAFAAAPAIVAVSAANAPTVVAAPTTDQPTVLAPVSPPTEAAAAGDDDLESYLQGILDGPSGDGAGAEDDDDDDDEVRSPRLRRATAAGGLCGLLATAAGNRCTGVCCLTARRAPAGSPRRLHGVGAECCGFLYRVPWWQVQSPKAAKRTTHNTPAARHNSTRNNINKSCIIRGIRKRIRFCEEY